MTEASVILCGIPPEHPSSNEKPKVDICPCCNTEQVICPECGSHCMTGYGLALGGVGAYYMCDSCDYSWKEDKRTEMDRPKIVAIIGSTRFKDFHLGAMQRETLKGNIVLCAGFFHHKDNVPISSEDKTKLDELSKRKIDIADSVYVVNVNGYVGETTTELIKYAKEKGKPISSMEPIGS